MEPDIVYLIACDDVEIDAVNLHRINLRGLMGRLLSNATPAFPVTRPEFCVFAMFAGGTGPIQIAVRIVSDSTGQTIFRTGARRIRFTGKPTDMTGATFRVRGCKFPAAGLYWIECLAGPNVIGRQRLWALPQRRVP